jgi:hypothetical protein
MLNSWGAPSLRPNGLFRMSMEMNYDGVYYYGSTALHSFFWQTANMVAAVPTAPAVTNSVGANPVSSNSARLNGEITSTGGENPTVHIYWGINDGGTNAANWAHDENLGALGAGRFYKDIAGLNPTSNYFYRCYAKNSAASGSWASATASFSTLYQKVVGADDGPDTWTSTVNYLVLNKFKAVNSGTMETFKIKATGNGNVKVAVYSDNNDYPGTLLSKVDTSTSVFAGWNDIKIPPITIEKDSYYWLAFNLGGANVVSYQQGSEPHIYKYVPYDTFTFPSNIGTGFDRVYGTGHLAGWASAPPAPPTPPTVTNGIEATCIGESSARLNGEVTNTGGEHPTVHIYWGDNDGGTTAGNWDHDENLGNLGAGTFYKDITALNQASNYFYRCYAKNSAASGSWASSTASFSTLYQKVVGADNGPDSWTSAVNYLVLNKFKATNSGTMDVFRVKATGNGNVKVAVYSDNNDYPGALLGKVDTSTSIVAGWNSIKIPSVSIVKDSYYWLAFNLGGANVISYQQGSEPHIYKYVPYDAFTFPSNIGTGFDRVYGTGHLAGWSSSPSLVVTNSNGASSTMAKLNGEIISTGGEDPTIHIYWGDNDGGTNPANWDNDVNLGIKTVGTFSTDLTGLASNTRYYYRCYAINSKKSCWASNTQSFITNYSS